MFMYSVKYLNYCIKNSRIELSKGVPNEDTHKVKLFSLESYQHRQKRIKKQIGTAKYYKRQKRKLEDKLGRSLNDVSDQW